LTRSTEWGNLRLALTNRRPPIIVKFSSPDVRMAVPQNKRISTPPPSEGAKRMVITEDLTAATNKKMKELHADDWVERVWTRSGSLWPIKKGANMAAFQVKSVIDPIDRILA
jgi:hypothetical protein